MTHPAAHASTTPDKAAVVVAETGEVEALRPHGGQGIDRVATGHWMVGKDEHASLPQRGRFEPGEHAVGA